MEELRRVSAPFRFWIPEELVPQLRELRSRQRYWSDVVESEDVVHLYYGLGPALFLAFDGRIIVDDYFNGTGVYEVVDPKEAWTSIAIGADVFEMPDLLCLLPKRPPDAMDCLDCQAIGWLRFSTTNGREGKVVCGVCGALGWINNRTF